MLVSVTVTNSRETEIVDALRSVVDSVDRVLLLDTGIADRTIELARAVAGDKLSVVQHAWVDFSAARNAGIDAAKALGATWIVVVDSDERIDCGAVNLRDALARMQVDVVLIESSDGSYPKEKFLRAACGARYAGPAHEALLGGSRGTLPGVTFSELPKTPQKLAEKFARDVSILGAYVREHPNDPRWWYYLGQSLEGLGSHAEAAEAFGACVARRRFGDEAAWAAYKQAEQLYILERFEDAIAAAARGMGANATFAECAWIAAVAASRLGRSVLAVAGARIAEAVGRFRGCGADRAFFRYLPALYELPYDVLRYALPDAAGRDKAEVDFIAAKNARVGVLDPLDLDRLSVSRRASPSNRNEARSMLRPATLAASCPSARAVQIRLDLPSGRRPTNPSICRHRGAIWCVVRTVNYSMIGRQYVVDDADNVVRSENLLGRLAPSGELIDPQPMRDLDPSPRQPSQILGYEDVRLVSVEDVLSGSATVCDRDASRRLIAKLDLDAVGNVARATVQASNQQHEKNWMPLSVDGQLAWIYSIDPTTVLPGPLLRHCPLQLDHLRGGAAIAFDDGYLCVTHEVVESNETRIYLHRFVRLDARFNVTTASRAWVFAHHGIEFCAGLVQDGSEFVMSYGLDDREAWVHRVDVEDVLAMEWIAQ